MLPRDAKGNFVTDAGSTARALGGALSDAAQIGDRIQQRRDLDEAFRVETKVLSDYNQFEADLRKTRRGAAAKGVVDDVDAWWSKLDDTYGADVSPRVKELTKKSLARARAQSMEAIGRYQFAEEDRAQVESFNAVNGQEIQNAVKDGRPEVTAAAQQKIEAAVNAFGAARGWSAEQLSQEKLKWSDVLHTQAVNAMINNAQTPEALKAAREYFTAHRDGIASSRYQGIEKALAKTAAEVNATANAEAWAALPFEEALAKARAITDPDERKLTTAAVRELQSEKNIAISLREKDASDKIWQLIADGASMKQLPRDVLRNMDGRDRMQVTQYYQAEQRRRESEAKGDAVKTDPAVYGKVLDLLREDPSNTRPEAFTGLSRSDIRSLQNHRDSLLNKTPKAANDVASTEQHMGVYITEMQLKDEKKGAFQKAAYDAFNDYRAANKKEPDYDARDVILKQLAVRKSGGWWLSPDTYAFQAPKGDERAKIVLDTVPQATKDELVAVLKKRGIAVTPQNVLLLYNEGTRK